MSRARVFIATSLDGFIAGPNGDLSWLPGPEEAGPDAGFAELMAEVGCLLMGRATYDVARGFEGPWAYGDTPVLVATHRTLDDPPPTVQSASGPIGALLDQARALARGRDVYVDGGNVIRQAWDADLLDLVVVTVCPTVLGQGHALFAGSTRRGSLVFRGARPLQAGLVQLTYTRP